MIGKGGVRKKERKEMAVREKRVKKREGKIIKKKIKKERTEKRDKKKKKYPSICFETKFYLSLHLFVYVAVSLLIYPLCFHQSTKGNFFSFLRGISFYLSIYLF